MGKNRRQERLRQRREQPAATGRPAQKMAPAWRYNLDQWGGPWVLVVGVVIIAFIGWMAWTNRPRTVSTDELRGEAVTIGQATHVASAAELQIPTGVPPAGGPHFINPLPSGVYDEVVEDGRAIHSLEHGLIWITYRPDGLSVMGTPSDPEGGRHEGAQGVHHHEPEPLPGARRPLGVASSLDG